MKYPFYYGLKNTRKSILGLNQSPSSLKDLGEFFRDFWMRIGDILPVEWVVVTIKQQWRFTEAANERVIFRFQPHILEMVGAMSSGKELNMNQLFWGSFHSLTRARSILTKENQF